MFRVFLLLVFCALTTWAIPKPINLPEPGQLALLLNEDEFEDYLDVWLENEEPKWTNVTRLTKTTGGCEIRVNGDLGQPQPVYIHRGNYLEPTSNTGRIHLDSGDQVVIACTGSGRTITHPNLSASVATAVSLTPGFLGDVESDLCICISKIRPITAHNSDFNYRSDSTSPKKPGTATCVSDAKISGDGWLSEDGEFLGLVCSSHAFHEAKATTQRCYNDNLVIRVGFAVNNTFFPLYWSCFDQNRLEVLYVWYEQKPYNAVHQTSVSRPSWLAGSFFPGVGINTQYTQVSQKAAIASLVGQELADKYVTSTQFLARGHLAAKTDFVYATGQRSSFYFINAAPQWQPFNAGNWNWLEQNLRARIGQAGYNTIIYTGTFGVSQLRNQNDELVDIYLYKDANNNDQLPVPLYYYKVVYEPTLKLGTAYVSINNPYYTEEEVKSLMFCTDHCRNNSDFSWLNWQADRIDIGYSFCCDVNEFRKTVPHLPAFDSEGILA